MADALDHFHFLQPLWLLLIPLLAWWLRRGAARLAWPTLLPPPRLRFPALAHIARQEEKADGKKMQRLPAGLLASALLAFVIALAQPVVDTVAVAEEPRAEPVDIVLLVGTAVTMNLRDYVAAGQPITRMAMLKNLLAEFVANYSGRNMGLVVLGDPPAIWLPLTDDRDVVLDAVGRLRTGLGGRLSDTGGALKLIAEKFSRGAKKRDDKVVVLVTDAGMQLGSLPPEAGARLLADKGFTLHTIAIGATGNASADENGTGLIYEPVDMALMQRLAEIGGGKAFHATDADAMAAALREIEQRHRRGVTTVTHQLVRPLYPWLVGLGMIFLLLAIVLSQRSPARRGATP